MKCSPRSRPPSSQLPMPGRWLRNHDQKQKRARFALGHSGDPQLRYSLEPYISIYIYIDFLFIYRYMIYVHIYLWLGTPSSAFTFLLGILGGEASLFRKLIPRYLGWILGIHCTQDHVLRLQCLRSAWLISGSCFLCHLLVAATAWLLEWTASHGRLDRAVIFLDDFWFRVIGDFWWLFLGADRNVTRLSGISSTSTSASVSTTTTTYRYTAHNYSFPYALVPPEPHRRVALTPVRQGVGGQREAPAGTSAP